MAAASQPRCRVTIVSGMRVSHIQGKIAGEQRTATPIDETTAARTSRFRAA
jgi:hypothetical protein